MPVFHHDLPYPLPENKILNYQANPYSPQNAHQVYQFPFQMHWWRPSLEIYYSTISLVSRRGENFLFLHDKNPPKVVGKPVEDPDDEKTKEAITQIEEKKKDLETIRTELGELKIERATLVAQITTLTRILGHVDNFETAHGTFVAEHHEEFENAGFRECVQAFPKFRAHIPRRNRPECGEQFNNRERKCAVG